ncbi:ABC transporter ATP-binding protein [Streptomyces sp. NA04227]|uniref:ABC transporter ATP-binding protein n=1 Tax=Streptomyces sp. NA04227 TaxID=2742136 RepID=UPI0020CA97AE|nr:ABC transporter ATP-binding protein [Streptomyces sp. NA04227]
MSRGTHTELPRGAGDRQPGETLQDHRVDAEADAAKNTADQAPTSLLRLDNVSKRYRRGRLAVDGVSLTVTRRETVALVGESGSGKSTLARLALGLLAPDAGTVRFDGHEPHRLRGRTGRRVRARLQFVPQQPGGSLNPALRAGEAVAFTLRVHGTPRRERPALVADLFRRVGLDPALARRHPRELSGGQLQRVALARALATGPDLLVCDEPTSALDTTVQAQILDLLTELRETLGLACLFISHDLAVVRRLAHRVVVLREGRVVEEATTAALWSAPGHPYTRALLAADDDGDHQSPTPPRPGDPARAGEPSAP